MDSLRKVALRKVRATKATFAHPLAQDLDLSMEEDWVGVIGVGGRGEGVVWQENVDIGPNKVHNAMFQG